MRLVLGLLLLFSIAMWIALGGYLVGVYEVPWVVERLTLLTLPASTAELGESFGVLSALLSSVALILALAAMLVQSRHQLDSNTIGGFSARQQFLLAECVRLEIQIKELKANADFKKELFDNMVSKKSRYLKEADQIDKKLQALLDKF